MIESLYLSQQHLLNIGQQLSIANIRAVNYSCWEWQLWGGPHRHYVIVPALQCNQQEIDKGKILKNASIHEPRPSELTFVTLELILWWCNADIGDMWQHNTWVWHSVCQHQALVVRYQTLSNIWGILNILDENICSSSSQCTYSQIEKQKLPILSMPYYCLGLSLL